MRAIPCLPSFPRKPAISHAKHLARQMEEGLHSMGAATPEKVIVQGETLVALDEKGECFHFFPVTGGLEFCSAKIKAETQQAKHLIIPSAQINKGSELPLLVIVLAMIVFYLFVIMQSCS